MIKGIYTAANGMITQYKKMDVVANNLANVNTNGFKRDGITTESFPEMLTKKLNDASEPNTIKDIGKMSLGVAVDKVYTNFTQGSLKQTDNPLNIAVEGDGFIVVGIRDKNGNIIERYTRDGSFALSPKGQLMTKDGKEVIGEDGSIFIPQGNISIMRNGQVMVDSINIAKLKLVKFDDNSALRKIGDNLYKVIEGTKPKEFKGNIIQGFLESSNVNTIKEMVEMISVARTYEANQKILQANDQTLDKAVNDLGRL